MCVVVVVVECLLEKYDFGECFQNIESMKTPLSSQLRLPHEILGENSGVKCPQSKLLVVTASLFKGSH